MAIHVLDEANRCLNCKVPQCQKGCPIHTPIPQVMENWMKLEKCCLKIIL